MTANQKEKHHSLGLYLAMCFSLLCIVLTFFLVIVIDITVTKQVKASIGTNLAEIARQMTYRLDRSMFERYREVQLMAERVVEMQTPQGRQQNRTALEAIQRTYPYYAWMGATDLQGKVLVATNGVLENADVSTRPWFENVKKSVYVGDVHEAKLLAKVLPNPAGEPMRFVDIAFPYASQGQPQGVLGAHLSWAWAQEIQRSILDAVGSQRKLDVLIVSSDNSVLLGPPELQGQTLNLNGLQNVSPGSRGFNIELFPDGHQYLVGVSQGIGYETYRGLGWKVLTRQLLEDAYLPLKELQAQVLWIGIAAASLFSLLGWWVASIVTKPLKALSLAAQQLEAGEPAKITVPATAYIEVTTLSRSLNSLIRNLQHKEKDLKDLNATLENRVIQRTRELTRALQDMRDNEHRIKTIVETAQGAFIGFNFQGIIIDWNSQAEKMFGWKREAILGRRLERLVPERFKAGLNKSLQLFNRTGVAHFINTSLEGLVITQDGKELLVEARIGLINTEKLKFFSAFLHDISQRKQIERMQNEFISTASHELRTPLTAIYASLDMVNSGMAGELPPDAKELLDISYRSTERLVRLINNVLDVEKIESHSMNYYQVVQPLLPLVEQSLKATQSYADQYQVQFSLLHDPLENLYVCVDSDRLIQVMVNLLSNAAKFSLPGGAVVTVRMQRLGTSIRVSVTDSGSGISENFRSRIFQRFAQADSSDRRQKGGTGLGLNICKSIVEAHKGSISFVSEPGEGATFYFDLPLSTPA